MKEEFKKELKALLEERINKVGFKMYKKTQSAHYGFFSNSEAVYDNRIVYSIKDIYKLLNEGFSGGEELGEFLFNMFCKP